MMKLPKLFVSFVFLFAILVGHNADGVPASSRLHGFARKNTGGVLASSRLQMRSQKVLKNPNQLIGKMFVFGDGYVDTGNRNYSAPSWNPPYGTTYPGQPHGRFSDGLVLTDYLANSLGLQIPPAYRFIVIPEELQHGVNFAYGGAGVFQSGSDYPNLTTQIGYLKTYLDDGNLTISDLEESASVFSINGNDYAAYLHSGGTLEGLPNFITFVVNRLSRDMDSLCDLGARMIALTTMPPLGCIPLLATSPTQCNDALNEYVVLHNDLLKAAASHLNATTNCSYIILDLYYAFQTVFDAGSFPNPYQACCQGISSDYTCGDVDDQGQPMYTVCSDPTSAFYWDLKNPTLAGWNATVELSWAPEQINYSFDH